MKQKKKIQILLFTALLLILAAGAVVLAQSSAGFNLSRHVIGGGGGESSSAGYRVAGTIGQSVAGPPTAGSASYVISSGFWFADGGTKVYIPTINR